MEKLGSGFGSLFDFFLVNAKTLLLYLEKEFVSFLVAFTNFIPYFLFKKKGFIIKFALGSLLDGDGCDILPAAFGVRYHK